MDHQTLTDALAGLPLGEIRYFETTGSTNDEAMAWFTADPPNLSVIVADEQTAGRGRAGRRWVTPRGAALACSVLLHPDQVVPDALSLVNGLGALAVSEALQKMGLASMIKWPNDVLLDGRKVAGILPEAQWMGEKLRGVVVGMGVNVAREAVPPAIGVNFPAGCVEDAWGQPVAREELLREVLTAFIFWLGALGTPRFIQTWETRLAFRDENVRILPPVGAPVLGQLLGLTKHGNLRLRVEGREQMVMVGEIHLRPV
ncbi:MAG: biotin--[acetyl-CoA-carboxylase] ligase [Anaerolineales bacterium]|nr:biotin--[acetyl-CoA-carboxylase] ligase [Anaerolineales bacterium]